jgi:hypothetical protein
MKHGFSYLKYSRMYDLIESGSISYLCYWQTQETLFSLNPEVLILAKNETRLYFVLGINYFQGGMGIILGIWVFF